MYMNFRSSETDCNVKLQLIHHAMQSISKTIVCRYEFVMSFNVSLPTVDMLGAPRTIYPLKPLAHLAIEVFFYGCETHSMYIHLVLRIVQKTKNSMIWSHNLPNVQHEVG